jgi:hypothetical protein
MLERQVASFKSVESIYAWGFVFSSHQGRYKRWKFTVYITCLHFMFTLSEVKHARLSMVPLCPTVFHPVQKHKGILRIRVTKQLSYEANSVNNIRCHSTRCQEGYLLTPKVKRQDPKITLNQALQLQCSVNALDTDNPGWTWFFSVSPGKCDDRTLN